LAYEFKICLDSNKLEHIESQLVWLTITEILKLRILLCKDHKGYFELTLLKNLREFCIFEVAVEFHGSMVHSRNKTTIVVTHPQAPC
jgi:hypothetical protein